jgi:hypothetical protein
MTATRVDLRLLRTNHHPVHEATNSTIRIANRFTSHHSMT